MWISSIRLKDFRSFKSLSLTASKDLNILVGDNNIGKTSVFIAVSKLINSVWPKTEEPFTLADIRQTHHQTGPLSVECTFSLDMNDKRDMVDLFSPTGFSLDAKRTLIKRINTIKLFDTLEVGRQWSERSARNYIKLGPLHVGGENTLSAIPAAPEPTVPLDTVAQLLVSSDHSPVIDQMMKGRTRWVADNIRGKILTTLIPKFSYFWEYRGRPCMMQRTASLESLEGGQTAGVLLNLKNHVDKQQRDRYTGIRHAFSTFFPQLKIEAIETAPSSGNADIQFTQIGGNLSLPTQNVGAGVLELLTLLTNLVTLRCHIFVIEEPELHLHPHMKRNLSEFIKRSSASNQVFVITHDPIFIDPDYIPNLTRFYCTDKKTGTLVASVSANLSPQDIGRLKTASKDITKRELYFARAVLFVEDESQQKFIEACAKKLEIGLDSQGISIIEVGGKDGFTPYITLAKQLDIPFICLQDLPWPAGSDRSRTTYRSLGCELEQYLEQAGCGPLMVEARQAVGTSKPRVAKYCGENIEVSLIPALFQQLLNDTVKLCRKYPRKKK